MSESAWWRALPARHTDRGVYVPLRLAEVWAWPIGGALFIVFGIYMEMRYDRPLWGGMFTWVVFAAFRAWEVRKCRRVLGEPGQAWLWLEAAPHGGTVLAGAQNLRVPLSTLVDVELRPQRFQQRLIVRRASPYAGRPPVESHLWLPKPVADAALTFLPDTLGLTVRVSPDTSTVQRHRRGAATNGVTQR